MVRKGTVPYLTSMNNADAAAKTSRAFIGKTDREHLIALLLDTRNHVNAVNLISMGTLNNSLVHPREVFKAAILANTNRIILVHNHPSGDPTPSRADIEITKRLIKAGKILDIGILDHIVLGDGRYTSIVAEHPELWR